MRTRWTAVAVGVLAVLGLGVAPARAADAPGTTTFSTTIPVHCSEVLANPPNEYDTTVVEAGTNPVAVTVGERLQVDFTRIDAPGALGADDRVLVLQVSGPVTPSGMVSVYPGSSGPATTFKATGAGTVAIGLAFTQGTTLFRGVNHFTQCHPQGTPPLTSFRATTKPVCLGVPATIVGSSGPDVLHGTAGPDVVYAGSGDDVIDARGGDDIVCGAHGSDTIDAGDGRDRVDGGYSNDTIRAKQGNDWIDGGSGSDTLDGGTGTDTCRNGEVLVSC